MSLVYFFILVVVGSVLAEAPPRKCHQNSGPANPPNGRPPHASSGAVATAYSSSSSSSSHSSSSSSAYASSSATASGCNDYNRCNDTNAIYKRCPNPCPATCENPEGVKNCYRKCQNYGCECKSGYVLSDNGKCILLKNCPDYLRCHGDHNAIFKECPSACPRTCQYPGGTGPCNKMCLKEGCECKEGFYLSETGKCVQLQNCSGAKACTSNETFVYCKVGCPNNNCPVNDNRGIIACSPPFPCESGCSCKGGYLRLGRESGRCILASECPPVHCTRQHEEWSGCPPPCLNERCADIGKPNECDEHFFSCQPQCLCKSGYCRNDSDICVPVKKCPPKCGYNEMYVKCKTICPPQSCENLYTEYACGILTCEPGCDCLPNHLRNASGICIPNDQCPANPPMICGYNEVASDCKIICPPQSCESIFTTYLCQKHPCEFGCNCLDGYLRNSTEICVPSEECFLEPDCDISSECRSTCTNPNPQNCPLVDAVKDNQDGCKCKPGYILSDINGGCIKIEECPADKGCNGDPNAIATSCPWPCPSTCDSPNAGSCGKVCKPVGCQCKPGFILSKKNGKCILPHKCKCGNPCGVNGTFSDCGFRCPNQNCPEDDSQVMIACKPGRPCPPGCLCKEYYKRNSDDTCVLASDCSPVECTRKHEVWNPCASECLVEKCTDLNENNDCIPDPKNCIPKCVCYKGFYRNATGDCVPYKDCKPPCPAQSCRPTCAVPNPPGCPFIESAETNDDDCNCQQGFVLSEAGGQCIRVQDCPVNLGCNGDPYAIVKEFPLPCPSTCDSPDALPCKKMSDPIGCECNPGYILSELDGECVLTDDCEGGNPCGPNATFVECKYNCHSTYCPEDDTRAVAICETYPFAPCYSGCVCNLNHRRFSREDPWCIRSDECPARFCTRQHEEWKNCPMDCRSEYCEAVDQPPVTCNTLVLNCNPQCMCKEGYFRHPETDLCVSSKQCRIYNKNHPITTD